MVEKVPILIEIEGKRYRGYLEVVEEFKYQPGEVVQRKVVLEGRKCKCGHLESEHLPECIYKVEGCECEGYSEGD